MPDSGKQPTTAHQPPYVHIHSRRGRRIAFTVDMGSKTYEIYFQSDQIELRLTPEALTAAMLTPCMASGLDWRSDNSLDATFAANLDTVQAIYSRWSKPLQPIQIVSKLTANAETGGDRTALFFSGGLDSFYSLEKNIDTIDDLVFLRGFDIEVTNERLWQASLGNAEKTARAYGKRLLAIETNIRELLDDYLPWGDSHGAVLAAVAHMLSPALARAYIASSCTYEELFPWGSHPLLDPLWSSSTLQIVHDGCESNRVQKAQRLAQSRKALACVRVCWEDLDTGLNCGKCEKCIRTMINFEVAGLEDYQRMFPTTLTPELVKRIPCITGGRVPLALENIAALRATGQRPDIADALEKVLRRSPELYAMKKRIRQRKRRIIARIGALLGASWYQDKTNRLQ